MLENIIPKGDYRTDKAQLTGLAMDELNDAIDSDLSKLSLMRDAIERLEMNVREKLQQQTQLAELVSECS